MPVLIVAATCVFDFLCVHPFRDGNGRVSRLLTTFLLRQHGFEVARYISLERLVEQHKQEYYNALQRCSNGWHEGKNELIPWWNFWLSTIKQGYAEFAQRVEAGAKSGKTELVRQSVLRQMEPFSLADLQAQCPSVSSQLIKKVLSNMKAKGFVRLRGRGRGASWELARRK